MAENPLHDEIEDIESVQKKINDKTSDEDKEEPGYILYSAILETSKSILNTDTFVEAYDRIKDKLGSEETKSLFTIISLAMTHSAYNAIQLYDHMLISQLNNTVNTWNDTISKISGIVNGHHGALEVFNHRISKLEELLKPKQ